MTSNKPFLLKKIPYTLPNYKSNYHNMNRL